MTVKKFYVHKFTFHDIFLLMNSFVCLQYATILIVIFIIQLALGILAFIAIKKGDKNEDETVHDHLEKLYQGILNNDKDDIDTINELQKDVSMNP